MFEVYLGESLFHGFRQPQNRLVEMFHSGTPVTVKDHVYSQVSQDKSHLRILISTIAFGMGVNCKKIRRVIHFGPSKSIEMYVQECGRAGRDGLQSVCVLLYNGLLMYNCKYDIKQYIQLQECRRKWMMQQFECKSECSNVQLHNCCDICQSRCDCGNCSSIWSPTISADAKDQPMIMIGSLAHTPTQCLRAVTSSQKEELSRQLWSLRQRLFRDVDCTTAISCPSVLFEFNSYHIEQVVQNCHSIFTIADVLHHVEIWRDCYAVGILNVLMEVFGDITDVPDLLEMEVDITNYSDWSNIRDDSTFISMLDSKDMANYSFLIETDSSFNDTV